MHDQKSDEKLKYPEIFTWYGWGSPVGWSLLMLSGALTLYIICQAVRLFF
jgi:hypothetical protein